MQMRRPSFHLSDIHNKDECLDKLDFIAKHYPKHGFFLTGDLTQDGRKGQYKWLKKHVLDRFRIDGICPGNHDVGEAGNFDLWWKLRAFDEVCGTRFSLSRRPHVQNWHGTDVISLNSNPGTWGWVWDFASGKIGWRQMRHYRRALRGTRSKIVLLHHHPFMTSKLMKLVDCTSFLQASMFSAKIMLFGHKHEQKMFKDVIYGLDFAHCAGALFEQDTALEIVTDGFGRIVKYGYQPII